MRMPIRFFAYFSVLAFLVGCATTETDTIGNLTYTEEKEPELTLEQLNHQQVRAEYQELLELFEDKKLKEQIERRIADVYMMEGVHDQNNAKPRESYYVEAIKAYRDVLEKYPDSPDNAEVFYQLAKAYDMEGNQDEAMKMLLELTGRHPSYANIAEAHFRKGDIYFNNKAYSNAENSYLAVTRLNNEKLKLNAHYMLGWSYYKQFQYKKSLDAFAFVLNQVLSKSTNIESLSKAEKPLAKDTIHAMSLTLDKMGGAEAIATIDSLADKDYVWMVYENLGDYYLEKELYEASASTYRLFVQKYNKSEKSPDLHSKLIETYIQGGFPRQALYEKETYVSSYGIYSNYPGNRDGIKPRIKRKIKIYLDELARHYHSKGQLIQEELAKSDKSKNRKIEPKKYAEKNKTALASFERAANFYQQYVETFPNDDRYDEVIFLKAEAYFLAGKFPEAITDYENVAYRPKGSSAKEEAADAGYAAIISYQKHIDNIKSDKKLVKDWQARAVESMLQFAEVFHTDNRSPSVLTNSAEYLFSLDQYERAVAVSSDLISKNKELDPTLKKTAYGIMAHSYFKLQDFANAEKAYINQRSLVASDTEEYKVISERLATTIYKNSEVLAKSDKKENAIDQLLKIKKLTPDSSIRVTAQFDATSMLLELKLWGRAIVELKDLVTNYSKHPLALEFPRKLAFAYEKNENWKEAADTYLELSNKDPDAEVRREALFLAANMFEKNKEYEKAIKHFKSYAYAFEEPFDTRMEARYHLAVNYGKIDDINRQLYWLRRIIDGDKKGGAKRTERSKWLGAWANIKYGDYFAWEFNKRKIRQPLAKSLPKKNEFLQNASKRYQMAADYGILEFVTMSSFKIAGMYQQFAEELRAAPKPRGLSADDQVVYTNIIEEQAGPFESLAMELHQANIERAWNGDFNEWIEKSFAQMKIMNPARYNKSELIVSYGDEIR